jgi:hypothetical protein
VIDVVDKTTDTVDTVVDKTTDTVKNLTGLLGKPR